MASARKRQRDRLAHAEARAMERDGAELERRWHALLQGEHDCTKPTRALAERRTALEAERATYLVRARSYRLDARAHNDALEWVETRWKAVPLADRNALRALWLLDGSIAWVARLGGDAAACERVGKQCAAGARGTPLESIPAPAWAAALAKWRGWVFGPTKGGRPPRKSANAGNRPDTILLALLRAGDVKKQRPRKAEADRKNRDAHGFRAKVNAAKALVKTGRRAELKKVQLAG